MRPQVAPSPLLSLHAAPLPDGVGAGQKEDAAADEPGEMAQVPRYRLTDEEADQGHHRLEQAEGDAHPDSGARIDSAQPDADRAGEVAEADRHADQQQTDQPRHVRNYMVAL